MIKLVLCALGLTAITVIVHGVGALASGRRVIGLWTARKDPPRWLGAEMLMAQLVGALLLLHLAEAIVWAGFYVLVGALPDLETAAYFSLTSYTTVGYGDVVLPAAWRLLGPIEAAVGVLMLGWSTGILVVVDRGDLPTVLSVADRARGLAGETARMTTPPAPATGWRAAFPPAQWLPTYQGAWLPRDAVAGVTLAAYAIPVSLAYATLAGLPPQYGIYCYLAGGLLYALFGSSRQLAVGPTSAISMLVGATVAGMADGDPGRWADIAALTALVVAGMSVLAWALRLSSLVDFISETILLGFKAGAALTIAMTQLPKLFGVKGGGEHFFERIAILAGQLPDTNVAVLAFGLVGARPAPRGREARCPAGRSRSPSWRFPSLRCR